MPKLASYFNEFRKEAFRLELLSAYNDPGDEIEFNRYINGEFFPNEDDLSEWLNFITNCKANGKLMRRVHVIPEQLTPYLCFEIEWGYIYTANKGESIYLLNFNDYKKLNLNFDPKDFWLFDDSFGGVLHYNEKGSLLEFEDFKKNEIQNYIQIKKELLNHAIPLGEFLKGFRLNRRGK